MRTSSSRAETRVSKSASRLGKALMAETYGVPASAPIERWGSGTRHLGAIGTPPGVCRAAVVQAPRAYRPASSGPGRRYARRSPLPPGHIEHVTRYLKAPKDRGRLIPLQPHPPPDTMSDPPHACYHALHKRNNCDHSCVRNAKVGSSTLLRSTASIPEDPGASQASGFFVCALCSAACLMP